MIIKDLERKYGNTITDVLLYKENLKMKLDKLINADEELERLKLNKNNILKQIYDVCINLRKLRQIEISEFKDKLENELKALGMKNAMFEVSFLNDISLDTIEKTFDENGADKIEFLFSANLGVEPRPLDKIISGGEMSRFMLAFKSLQNSNRHKTCIFDEIDTGIGGEIGSVVGKKICEISRNTQVICITHLPQIACFGDTNFKIEKYDENNVTITSVRQINDNDKTEEIARMLSGSINKISIDHASEIIDNANGFKKFISQ
jgi:DNA repair protein RecN (Recombination protein N)